ncbi:hypothetical protein MMC14_009863 [Varicellaria rhodocarpa]|nr:hypothetical protein [Varicellaria rhodocarpa]
MPTHRSSLLGLLLANYSSALFTDSILPPSFTVEEIGMANDTAFPNVYRDGGGGGLVNGKNIIVYSDTSTTSGGPSASLRYFTSNSIAYSNTQNPTSLTDFGSNGAPNLGVPFQPNESAFTTANWNTKHERIAIWPGSSLITPAYQTTAIGFYPILTVNGSGYTNLLYTSVVAVTVSSTGPMVERTVPQLFYAGEIIYGGFSAAVSNIDGNILLFAAAGNGVKVARVAPTEYTDRTQYTYWTGTNWSQTPPSADSTTANIFSVPVCSLSGDCNYFSAGGSSGDIFYSPYFKTWLAVYFDGFPDNTFRFRYSLDGQVTGAWSDQMDLYETVQGNTFNYAGHAYPGYDQTGKTLLLSWTYEGEHTKMAQVTFK